MLIVPLAARLTVEARVPPSDIDQLRTGLTVRLRFTAFNQRTTPDLAGVVTTISADISSGQRTGASFYTARIAIAPEELAQLHGLKLVPGMPVETFIETHQRSVLSYLVKPLRDQMTKAFREK